jgi:hypothetical protein
MSATPSWTQIKAQLETLSKAELFDLLKAVYQLNADTKVFFVSRLTSTPTAELMEPYKKSIRKVFNPDRGLPDFKIANAKKALNDFKKACSEPVAVVDLYLFYVEQGVICTLNYGDINEGFYSSLEAVYDDAVKQVLNINNEEVTQKFRPRFRNIVSKTSGIGWGFHDALSEMYCYQYPPE